VFHRFDSVAPASVGRNFFHHGAPGWSYLDVAGGPGLLGVTGFAGGLVDLRAARELAAGTGAFFATGCFWRAFGALGFGWAFFAMMTSPPRQTRLLKNRDGSAVQVPSRDS
jgi:hypothetical protein